MNIKYFIRNLKTANRITKNYTHTIRYLILNYEKRLRAVFNLKSTIQISYRFPEPIGEINLLQRLNSGSDNYIFSEVFIDKCYDIDLLSTPEKILDLGANVGYSSIYFKKKYPSARVACVEPIEENLSILKQNIELNSLSIKVLEAAVSSTAGLVHMEKGTKDYNYVVTNNQKDNSVVVQALTIDQILCTLGWDTIDLIKIDIEGSEKELFSKNTEWLYKVNNLIIEAHFPIFTENDIKYLVREYDFAEYSIINGLFFLQRANQNKVDVY